jgi:hypothetical protein
MKPQKPNVESRYFSHQVSSESESVGGQQSASVRGTGKKVWWFPQPREKRLFGTYSTPNVQYPATDDLNTDNWSVILNNNVAGIVVKLLGSGLIMP